jgi:hypothetical protein
MNNTDKKIVLEEMDRMMTLMGLKENSISTINESVGPGKGIFDEVIPGGTKTLDNLGALGKTYDDLFTYSSRMSELVPSKNIDDFIALVSKQNDDVTVTPEMLKSFIANDPILTKELMETAAKIAEERVALLLSNISFSKLFKDAGFPEVPNKINATLKIPVEDTNIGIINQSLDLMENLIKGNETLKNSNEGKELLDQIAGKRQQINDFKTFKESVVSGQRKPNDLKTKIEDLIYNSIDDNESKILILRQMADEMEKAAKLRRDVTKRFGEGNK